MSAMRRLIHLSLLLVLGLTAACGRPLVPAERAFLGNLHGADMDLARVRLVDGFPAPRTTVATPPRVTCQSRLYPPIAAPTFRGASPAMTLFDTVLVRHDWYAPDMTGGYPDILDLPSAMILAHETLHVWQWQHRRQTGYTPLRAALEHFGSADPYLFDPNSDADFRAFSYEQQGAVIEEYLCCRVLAPDAARTRRLHRMIGRVLPLTPLSQPLARHVRLPWKGVELRHICD
jgi:hypothetical protein